MYLLVSPNGEILCSDLETREAALVHEAQWQADWAKYGDGTAAQEGRAIEETPRIRQYREYAAMLRAEIARKEGSAMSDKQVADYKRELESTESHLAWLLEDKN